MAVELGCVWPRRKHTDQLYEYIILHEIWRHILPYDVSHEYCTYQFVRNRLQQLHHLTILRQMLFIHDFVRMPMQR